MSERLSSREVSRRAVRRQIETVAMELFLESGFDTVTIDRIATEAGVSQRTFFRYFPTKEDLVVGDPMEFGSILRDLLEARPADEPAAEAVEHALEEFTGHVHRNPAALGISKIMFTLGTPGLRAKHIEKNAVWQELLLPDVLRRLGDAPDAELRGRALIASGLAVFETVLAFWASHGGDVRELLLRAFGEPSRRQ
ncbi:AcrR family transcriptional regulator [Catenuloplanes nepalensis]|uniref:AcrR family transcriptional regulator n=1 Tax=Catenuloplanes nepalensis TaxID=587533 RepID=A0ABT9MMZ0_9ACTN|nr:TetR family transcriptional regulator [Catenuloplanes nepalensis]MDP9792800.1 AcrR family transcriptional regulator [Catenuloplanes nepalensis]